MSEPGTAGVARVTPLTRALDTIRALRSQLAERSADEPVAIVGIGLRLPGGVADLRSYWQLIQDGGDAAGAYPADRMGAFADRWAGLPQHGGFLPEVLDFDAAFFGISPREARALDPQHRLLLEVCWEAIEDAAIPGPALSEATTGVYLGITGSEYREWMPPAVPDAYWATGNGSCFAAGRIAYTLGLRGPSVAVDTACSSSLVALHHAVHALQRGECETAIVAGVNLILSPATTALLARTRSLSPDGRCKAFDARANGFGRGEGCVAVVLKRLDRARTDRDRVHAVIRGSAVNQDGRSTGFTAPNVLAQVSVIRAALADATLTPADIGFVETHGTGTALGDPIEMAALVEALGRPAAPAPIVVGAVKADIGHLEAAAGLAGVVKAALCLRHRSFGPVNHFRTLNPRIDLTGTGIDIPVTRTCWSEAAGRFAGISSFGMSGTNAHVVLGAPEAVEPVAPTVSAGAEPGFEISARSPEALRALAERYDRFLGTVPEGDYPAFVEAVGTGRTRHDRRAWIDAPTVEDARRRLRALAAGTEPARCAPAGFGSTVRRTRTVIELPSYPWQRVRFAPSEDPVAGGPGAAVAAAEPVAAGPELSVGPARGQRFGLTWSAIDESRFAGRAPGGPADVRLVLAGNDDELLRLLLAAARADGRVGTVLSGGELGPLPPGWCRQPLPESSAEWAAWWAADPAAGATRVVLVPAIEPDGADPATVGARLCLRVAAAVTGAPESAGSSGTDRRALLLVTSGARRIGPDDRVVDWKGGLLQGLSATIGLEHGGCWAGVVDLPASPQRCDARALLALSCAFPEPGRSSGGTPAAEDMLAIRNGRTLLARLAPADAPAHSRQPAEPLRPDATYLVSGALGAVGRAVVTDLIGRGARHLLLVGRRSDAELDEGATRWLTGLRDDGVELLYLGGGCGGTSAVTGIRRALAELPPLRGVVHAAGTIERQPTREMELTTTVEQLQAKAVGGWQLHTLTDGIPLEFFVLVSSLSSLIGAGGYPAYAAANGALDAIAAHRAARGLPATAIAFGPWAVGGMAGEQDRDRFDRIGVGALTPGEGCAALAGAIAGGDYTVACRLDRGRFARAMADLRSRGLFAVIAPPPGPATGGIGPVGLTPAESGPVAVAPPPGLTVQAARRAVADHVAAELGHARGAEISPNTGFLDLGLDSIMAVDLAGRLTAACGLRVDVMEIFDHPTVARLGEHLARRAGGGPSAPSVAPSVVPAAVPEVEAPSRPAAGAGKGASPKRSDDRAVAIVGMAGRFPGAASVDDLWHLLEQGRDPIGAIPDDRPDLARAAAACGGFDGLTTDQGGFLDDVDRFDAAFFELSDREARSLDPQHRLLLQCAWHALEDSGISPDAVRDTATGVFVGISNCDYARLLGRAGDGVDAYYGTGTALNAAAGRISHLLGLHGPALAVDTACSSSLVAVHLAVRSLRSGESDTVLAGGVNLILDPLPTLAVSRAHMLSPDGRCRSFAAGANGFVRAEGVGVLVLKRLTDAIRDGNRVLAVIGGTAINQDGASSGLTAPNGRAQEAVIAAALADAGVAGADVEFLEAHGTGTEIGDPIEIAAAWRALGAGRPSDRPLRIGSVKSNLGHCESAAGVVSLIKTVLALQHQVIPANLHVAAHNPHVPWGEMNVSVVDRSAAWPRTDRPRVAGVSGFGFSGTNAHVVLTDGPPMPGAGGPARGRPLAIPLSAPDPAGLERLTERWRRLLADCPAEDLPSLAVQAGSGRRHFANRRVLTGTTGPELLAGADGPMTAAAAGREPRVAFLFSGQGSQYAGMGRELYDTEPVFRDVADRCDAVLAPLLGRSIVERMRQTADPRAIDETEVTQPALVTLEVALAALWESWGVRPAAVMGHSVGAVSAAVVSGMIGLDDGLRLIAHRSRLMQGTAPGAMLAVPLGVDDVAGWVADHHLDVAAVNGPALTVVSGSPEAIGRFADSAGARGVRCRRLAVTRAFHSRLLDPILDEFARTLSTVRFDHSRLPFVSDLTGRPQTGTDAAYWVEHARRPVQFFAAAGQLADLGADVGLEIGPDRTLVTLLRSAGSTPPGGGLCSLHRGRSDRSSMLGAVAELYRNGQTLTWAAVAVDRGGRRVTAPRYPFARERHWVSPPVASAPVTVDRGPAWGRPVRSPALSAEVFGTVRTVDYPAHLTDHRLYGTVSVPGTSQVATALSAFGHPAGTVLEDVHFPRALVIADGERYELQIVRGGGTSAGPGSGVPISVQSLVDPQTGRWQEHLAGSIRPLVASGSGAEEAEHAGGPVDVVGFAATADRHLSGADFYAHFHGLGYHLGPSFRWIRDIWITGDEALVRYRQPAELRESPSDYVVHPGLLDSLLQGSVAFEVPDSGTATEADELAVPFAADRIVLRGTPPENLPLWGRVRRRARANPDGSDPVDLRMFDESGRTFLEVHGFRMRTATRQVLRSSLRADVPRLQIIRWSPQEEPGPHGPARVMVVGDDVATGPIRAVLTAAGHLPVDPAGPSARQVVVDTRWCVDGSDPSAAVVEEAAWELAWSLRGAPPALAQVVLVPGGDPNGIDRSAPLREALSGMLAALRVEQPDRVLTTVRIDPGWDPADLSSVVAAAADGRGGVVRLGPTGRRSAELVPLPSDDRLAPTDPPADLTGSALITGGLGGLGPSAAAALARAGITAVTLMGRSTPDPATLRAIERLRSDGLPVRVVRGDVGRRSSCRAAIETAERDGPLRVVLHLAGATADGAFEGLSRASFGSVFAAKAAGADILVDALGDRKPAALVFFSSVSSVLGSAGQVNYAAANGYLNGLAARLRSRGVPAVSVGWGPWVPATGGGLAGTPEAQRAMRAHGVRPLTDDEAASLLGVALAGRDAHVVAVALDRPSDGGVARRRPASGPTRASGHPAAGWLRADLNGLDAGPARSRLHRGIVDLCAEILGKSDDLDSQRGFVELGFDSIMVIDLRTRLAHALGVDLPATLAFDHPCIDRVTEFVLTRMGPAGPTPTPPQRREVTVEDIDLDLAALTFEQLVKAVEDDLAGSE